MILYNIKNLILIKLENFSFKISLLKYCFLTITVFILNGLLMPYQFLRLNPNCFTSLAVFHWSDKTFERYQPHLLPRKMWNTFHSFLLLSYYFCFFYTCIFTNIIIIFQYLTGDTLLSIELMISATWTDNSWFLSKSLSTR